jgi:hypothetical protein
MTISSYNNPAIHGLFRDKFSEDCYTLDYPKHNSVNAVLISTFREDFLFKAFSDFLEFYFLCI